MAIWHDNSTAFNTASTNPWTFEHIVGAGANFLVVGHCNAYFGSPTISGMTYGGDAMTQIATKTYSDCHSSFYYLVNPKIGANNVVITLSGSQEGSAGAVSRYGHRRAARPGFPGQGTGRRDPPITVDPRRPYRRAS